MRISSSTWAVSILLLALLAPTVRADEPPEPAQGEHAGVAFEPGAPALPEILAKAAADEKPAFLDFFTDT